MKNLKYAFLTSTLSYLMGAGLLFLFIVSLEGWRFNGNTLAFLAGGMTLALSEFTWWGSLYYLAILVPWLGSALVLWLLLRWSDGAGRRKMLGALSVFAYFFVMFLTFIIRGLLSGWGDIGYQLLWLWPFGGFGLGYLGASIAEKIIKPQPVGGIEES